jgi:glyoxylase-like metal-dependent hydrolase (beta-lactamase superfamily II)
MELARNIHLIPKIRGANSYAILKGTQVEGGGHLTLIDTGMPGNAVRIIEFLNTLGREYLDGFSIILTHSDIDHSGSVAELKDKLGNVKIAIHEADAPRGSDFSTRSKGRFCSVQSVV